MRFHIAAYENTKAFDRFGPYQYDDPLELVTEFDVEASSPEDACDVAWIIGNKQEPGWQKDWPATRRSMSVGDVLVVDHDAAYAVDRIGFVRVSLRTKDDDFMAWRNAWIPGGE